jgi:hypothetical protein
VVVEDRYSKLFDLTFVRPATVADALAEAAVRFPSVPVFFAETRALAEQWTYRYLAAALTEVGLEQAGDTVELPVAGTLPPAPASVTQVRAWARQAGLEVADRGRLRPEIWDAYRQAH